MKSDFENLSGPILNIVVKAFPNMSAGKIAYTRVVIPKEQAWGTYNIRYQIKVDKQVLNPNEEISYKNALDKLKNFDEENVSVHVFHNEKNVALIVFADITDYKVVGHILFRS